MSAPAAKAPNKLRVFLEMIKFEHSIFALPFAYLGLFLAEGGLPRPGVFAWVTVAMVSFRTLGMALNRLIDAKIDAANPRTQGRALPAGALSRSFVRAAAVLSALVFEMSAALLGPVCLALSPVVLLLAWLYPWTKRFTWLSHAVLGIILGIAPSAAWIASRGELSWTAGLLSLGVFTWVAGFDIFYSLQDVDFDRKTGLYSFPARFGEKKALAAAFVLHVLTVAAWAAAGLTAGLGTVYFAGIALVALFLAREHWLVRTAGLEKINEAFFTLNAFTSVAVFLAVFLDLALKGKFS